MRLVSSQKDPRVLSLSFHHGKTQSEADLLGSGPSPDTAPAGTLILDFPDSRTLRNELLLFSHLIHDIFVIAA